MPQRFHAVLVAFAAGTVAAAGAVYFAPRVSNAGRVNIIGPLEATAEIDRFDGVPLTVSYVLAADVRRPALFVPYAERAKAEVVVTNPAPMPHDLDRAALDRAVVEFATAQTPAHPGLARVDVPSFRADTATNRASTSETTYEWAGILINAVAINAIGVFAGTLSFIALALKTRWRAARETQLETDTSRELAWSLDEPED
jgi:hypothetical protein